MLVSTRLATRVQILSFPVALLGRVLGKNHVFLALTLPWFAIAAATYPGLASYLLRDEVVGRIATHAHHRNSQWTMGLWIYPAVAVAGALPWSPSTMSASAIPTWASA